MEEEPLNVLLVTIDTLRRDHVGCYGYFRDTTPRLDALAEESLVFDDLQVHIAQALPSHTSLFTGLSPREHGIESNLGRLNERYLLSPKIRTLATVLGEQILALLPEIDRRELTVQSSGRDVLAVEFQAPPRYTIVPPMPDGVDWSERLPRYRHALEHDGWRLVIREDAAVELCAHSGGVPTRS